MVDDKVFIDRDPRIFSMLLNYLRTNGLNFNIEDSTTSDLFKYELKHWKLNASKTELALQQIMNSEPQNVQKHTLDKWKDLGYFNIDKLLEDEKLKFDPEVPISTIVNKQFNE